MASHRRISGYHSYSPVAYATVATRVETGTRRDTEGRAASRPCGGSVAFVRAPTDGTGAGRNTSGVSAICYCSARASILEAPAAPRPLSRPLQILTTRRRNWRDISNLESFRDTHLLSRLEPRPPPPPFHDGGGIKFVSLRGRRLEISCTIEDRDFATS